MRTHLPRGGQFRLKVRTATSRRCNTGEVSEGQRLPQEAALALLRARIGDLPEGHDIRLIEVGLALWRGFYVENGRPYVGGSFLVTPDARLWVLSSNPGIHDSGLAERLLERAFNEGLGELIDQEKFLVLL